MIISHTFGVAEESGTWYITIDGETTRNRTYRTEEIARDVANRLTTTNNLWRTVFQIETSIAEALKDTPWPYGATCVNNGTDTNPKWVLTQPYLTDDKAVKTVNPDPTGYVQITIYTRDLYETACRIIDVEPFPDTTITDEFCDCEHGHYIPDDIDPIDAVKNRLAYRRSIGITIERLAEQNKRAELLEKAGLMLTAFTRDQYAQACEIMGVPVLDDRQVITAVTMDVAEEIGIKIQSPGIPTDFVTTNLAYRRSMGICQERHDQDDTEAEGEEKNRNTAPNTTT